MANLKIIVSGKVQGVFFRHNTQKFAKSLDLKGYVKNLSNGNVEVVAVGDEKQLKKLIEFCKNGPEHAKVSNINVKYFVCKEMFEDFKIIY